MMYPDYRKYICKFCSRKFEFSSGANLPRLIEHLMMEHKNQEKEYGNLYLSSIVGRCFESTGGAHD